MSVIVKLSDRGWDELLAILMVKMRLVDVTVTAADVEAAALFDKMVSVEGDGTGGGRLWLRIIKELHGE